MTMKQRDDLDLFSMDLIEIRRNGVVITEFYVEPEQQHLIDAQAKKMQEVLDPPSRPKLTLVLN